MTQDAELDSSHRGEEGVCRHGGHSLQKGLAPGLGQEKYKMGLKQGSAQRNDGNVAKGHGNQLEWAPNCLRSSLNLKNKGSNRL